MPQRALSTKEASNLQALRELGAAPHLLFLTDTMMNRSIIDAVSDVRAHFAAVGIHDYASQGRGEENKVVRETLLHGPEGIHRSVASLYRPRSGDGDPRIWFSHLGDVADSGDVLAVFARGDSIEVVNLTDSTLADDVRANRASPLISHLQGIEGDYSGDPRNLGEPYRRIEVPEEARREERPPRDPDAFGRGLKAHEATRDALASAATSKGLDPRQGEVDPLFDLGWRRRDGRFVMCEVKSLTARNQTSQLRLGLGQILDYHDRLSMTGTESVLVVAVEKEPGGSGRWLRLFEKHRVKLVWPETFEDMLKE